MRHMAMNVNYLTKFNISIKFESSIQFVMLEPAVNRQPGFRRGLVEQSNAEKNTLLAGWLTGCWLGLCRPGGWLTHADWQASWQIHFRSAFKRLAG